LMAALGPTGTLIMPAYNSAEEAVKKSRRGTPIDLRTSPSEVGIITEVFRTTPGVRRSSHPFSSACAWGVKAQHITESHTEAPEVCHPSSPVGRLVECQGTIVGIGIPIAQGLGVAHCVEDTYKTFPFEVHSDQFEIQYIDADGQVIQRRVSRYDPNVARTRIDYPDGKWIGERLTAHLERVGILKRFRYGCADSWSMRADILYEELKRLADKGVTMYLTPDKLDDRNRDTENW
jgi:aminoglycoside 3-N-acetyltransferase